MNTYILLLFYYIFYKFYKFINFINLKLFQYPAIYYNRYENDIIIPHNSCKLGFWPRVDINSSV